MKLREMISCVRSSSSATPMTDNRVDALTISAAVLTQAGRHWRSACGSTDEKVWAKLRPMALAASVWPGEWPAARRARSRRRATSRTPPAPARRPRRVPGPGRWPPTRIAGQHQDQHRRAAHDVDVGPQRQARGPAAIGQRQAGQHAQDGARGDGQQRDRHRDRQAVQDDLAGGLVQERSATWDSPGQRQAALDQAARRR